MLEDKEEKNTYSIVVPVYNSAKMLRELHQRLVLVMEKMGEPFEIIFVEDYSPDQSWKVLESLSALDNRVTAIQLMRNFGQGSATLCGLAHVQGEFAITLDDDLQNPPEEIPSLIQALYSNQELDIIIGVPQKKRHNLIRRLGSNFINQMNSYFLRKDPNLRLTSFRVMRHSVVEALLTQRVPYPAIGPMLISVTRRIGNVTVRHDPRKEGRSGYTIRRLLKQTLSYFIGYSMLPLRLLAVIGGIGIVVSFLIGVVYLLRYLIWGSSVPGWTSLMLVLIALSGFNFFAFAVLGEYIFRIFYLESTTKQYLIRKCVGRNQMKL